MEFDYSDRVLHDRNWEVSLQAAQDAAAQLITHPEPLGLLQLPQRYRQYLAQSEEVVAQMLTQFRQLVVIGMGGRYRVRLL